MSADSSDAADQRRLVPAWLLASGITLGVVCLFFVSQLVGGVILGFYAAAQGWSAAQIDAWFARSITAQFAFSLIAEGGLLVGVGLGLHWLRWKWADIGLVAPKLKHLAYGLLAAVPYYVLYLAAIAAVSAVVPSLNVDQKQEIGFTGAHGPLELGLTYVGIVLLPALAEEVTMRGLLYTGLKKWLPKIVAALVVSVLFGAAHLAEGGSAGPLWVGAIDTFTLSLVLVYLREKTGNLWAGIVLHAVKNSVAFVALFIVT